MQEIRSFSFAEWLGSVVVAGLLEKSVALMRQEMVVDLSSLLVESESFSPQGQQIEGWR